MSILTKIFVVLVTLLSVATATLIVAFVTNVHNYKDGNVQLKSELAIAVQRAESAQADVERDLNAKNTELTQLSGQIGDLRQQVNTLTTERDRLQQAVVDGRRMNDDIGVRLDQLSSGFDQLATINGVLQTEIRVRREESLKLQTRNIELAAEVRDKSVTLDQAQLMVKRLKEQLADAANRLRELETMTAGMREVESEDVVSPRPDFPILGEVTDVREVGGSLLVELNVGMNDSVLPNMEFVLHDGGLFLANAQIIEVDENASGARVTLLKQGVRADQIKTGVRAMTMAGP